MIPLMNSGPDVPAWNFTCRRHLQLFDMNLSQVVKAGLIDIALTTFLLDVHSICFVTFVNPPLGRMDLYPTLLDFMWEDE